MENIVEKDLLETTEKELEVFLNKYPKYVECQMEFEARMNGQSSVNTRLIRLVEASRDFWQVKRG